MGLSDIGEQVRQLLSTAGRSLNTTDPGAAIVRRVNAVLMVFDDRLYHLESGCWATLAERDSTADSIADAAAAVLANADAPGSAETGGRADSRKILQHNVLLLLPPSDFLATPVDLPGVAPGAVRPALQLQADSLLPGFDDPLSLAVNVEENAQAADPLTAFWLPTTTLNALHHAFADQSLFLAAVMPRPALLASQQEAVTVDDRDSGYQVLLSCRDGIVRHCLQTSLADLSVPAFDEQWQAETAVVTASAQQVLTLRSAEDYRQAWQQHISDARHPSGRGYAMVPDAALAARHQFDKGKRLWLAAAMLAAVAVLGALPFVVQSLQLRSLERSLAEQQQLAAPAREDQLAVRDFESRWGVLTEFPDQDVSAMLLALQAEMRPNVLTSLELDEGYISIEGESNDPQGLLQQLEMNPLFTEVDFARATSNNRFYIDLRLTTVNFPVYQEWYFPEDD
ncbi:MAG: hypothetical protein CMQ34_03075 [Gammaproteobacteria bacterium]|nr:hypothetical protein [Gammaproteobacteria bacterium]|tara:strand:+ start:488 stop:1849 length:1362 start_codon:yes stop_codon:yes gene_type:complete